MNRSTWMSLIILAIALSGCATPRRSHANLPMPELARSPIVTTPTETPSRDPATDPISRPDPVAAVDHDAAWQADNPRAWRYIVIHHSATDTGSASSFNHAHRERGWDELGYHFVINNGTGQRDGIVEVGSRWPKQKHGAHCGGTPDNEYNERGIGICLVGDFSDRLPSQAQLASLGRLVTYLAVTHDIPPQRIIGHLDAPGAHTLCPGSRLYSYLTRRLVPSIQPQIARHRE